ncbi:unnamed protein product, partial [Closterium sp. NIES-54]
HLLAAETSIVAVGAARGTKRTPFFEGCSPSPLAPSYAFVWAAFASVKHRSSKGKSGRGAGGDSGGGGGGSSGGGGGSGGGGSGGSGGESGGFGGRGGGSGGSGGSGSGGSGNGRARAQRGGSGGGQRQQQQRRSETPSPQQLCEWFARRRASGGSGSCPYVIRTGDRAGQTCGKPHIQHRCFSRLDDAWCAEFDYDAIRSAMYALSVSAEGDCYPCVPPDPGIEATAVGASESVLPGTAPVEALHTFTLDLGASRYFFRDITTLTPLSASVPVRLADPSGGPVLSCSSTVLPCPAVLSGSLSGLHLPLFSTNLVSTAALQDAMVTTTTPGGQRVSICTCTRTDRHLATFTRRPGSSLYTLATEPPQVAASAQVSASGQVAPPCSCRLLSHQTLLWHNRLGHPSLPRIRGIHSRLLVSGLPRSLPPLTPSPAPPCLPCVEGRQRAAPHSSSFPPKTAPLQTLHMDVWGPARVSGQGREHYFLLVVDDYTRYTTVFPLRRKGQVVDVLIPWIRAVRLQLRERFRADLPVLRLHSDRGGEFSSDLLRDFCCGEGIRLSFMLPDSPQQNGIAERRIGLVMEVARTSMIHAAAPHFLWPFAGSRAFVRDTSADKLSARAIPWVFLGFSRDAPGSPFYHPTSCRVFPTQDVTFDESVPFYRLFPYRSAPSPPPPLFLAPGPPPVDPLPPQGPSPSGVSQVDPLPGTAPVEVAVGSGAASGGAEPGGAESEGAGSGGAKPGGAEPGGAEPAGAEPKGVEPGGAEPEGVDPGGAKSEGAESGGAEPQGTASSGGFAAGGAGDSAPGDTGAGGAGVPAGAGGTGGAGAAGPRGARTRGTGAAGTGGLGGVGAGDPTEPGAAGAGGAGAVDPGAGGARDTVRPRPYFVPLLQQVLGVLSSTGLTPTLPTALLLGSLHEEIWLRRPPGFTGSFPAGTQWSLWRPVYGLRQAPREWHDTLRTTLTALGLTPSTADPSLSLRTDTSLPLFYVLVYVDDLVFATTDTEALILVKSELQKRHTCTDLGELRSYLGLQITRDRARPTITLTQSHMVHQVLQRFGFQFSLPQPTPLSTGHSLSAPPSDESVEPSGPYPELMGCRMYLMTCTRPDLAYPLSLLARYVAPGRHRKVHWDAAKRVLRYLCSKPGMGLVLGRGPAVLTGHANTSWVDDSAMQQSS